MTSAQKGEGVKKRTKLADIQYSLCRQRGGGCQKIPKLCGRHLWKPSNGGGGGDSVSRDVKGARLLSSSSESESESATSEQIGKCVRRLRRRGN